MTHIPFPEIQQFRNTIRTVRERAEHDGKPVPTLTFIGSVKLHGINASVVFPVDGGYYCQSRSQIITNEHDNAGFATWVSSNINLFSKLDKSGLVVYGEWCGQGIQKGVAISQVPKQFIVFAVRRIDGEWMSWLGISLAVGDDLKCIYNYPTWTLDIDFNHPEEVQNLLVALTQAVEAECPVGKAFGVSGVGEGIVWQPLRDNTYFNTSDLAFKVKGEKHSETQVKTLAAVDVEKMNSLNELVDSILTEHRMEKKIESLIEQGGSLDLKQTGAFLKLVGSDVYKEESDTIAASGFKDGEVMGAVQKKAKQFWMKKLSI